MKTLGLKIDVDTYWGMKKGIPRLLSILADAEVKGTFFLSMGPDASGRAIFQLVKNKKFLKKMIRTNAIALYGIRTALYGTLLPSPLIAMSFPDIVYQIVGQGHEVQFHAWDHRRWQDGLKDRSEEWIEDWFKKGIAAFKKLLGQVPTSFGAPAWMIDDRVIRVIKKYDFEYLSCTRAKIPFIHEGAGLIEIPSDLPCFEEIGLEHGISTIEEILKNGGIHVLPVHAEVEGGVFDQHFIRLLGIIKSMNYNVNTLGEIKNLLKKNLLITRMHHMTILPGRSSPCAV
jgi:hypothetical protein